MSKKKNLPAVNELNLFTSSENIQPEKVAEVRIAITKAKKIMIRGAEDFTTYTHDVYIKTVGGLNKDTLMHIVDMYQFEKPKTVTYDNLLSFIANKTIICSTGQNILIQMITDTTKINLISNDIKQEITA